MQRAILLVAFTLIACRPSPAPDSSASDAPAASGAAFASAASAAAPASVNAAPDAGAAAPDAGAAASPRPLPSPDRLRAPFLGRRAHGFVAMTRTASALTPEERHTYVALVPGAPVDVAKPVLVASFTKLFTAVAALRLVERGELSLDDTVQSRLPELGSRPWASSTLHELLTHTSLVPEFDEKGGYYRRADVDFASPVATLAANVPASWTEKRGIYKYRNAELALVGAILAARAGLPAAAVLLREVFAPAGMTHAGLLGKSAPAGLDLAPMGGIHPQTFFTAGAGYASPADLLAFFDALAGTKLLSAASKATLFDGDPRRSYGALGCWAYPFADPEGGTTRLVERPGSFGNVRLFAAFFPDEGRAVVAYTGDGIEITRPRSGRGIGPALARIALE